MRGTKLRLVVLLRILGVEAVDVLQEDQAMETEHLGDDEEPEVAPVARQRPASGGGSQK